MTQSQKMRKALERYVIPDLLSKGFVGTYPHYRKDYSDRAELLVFQSNKWGNSFAIEVSTIFLPECKRDDNFCSREFTLYPDATVWDTNIRFRLKGMFDGWFYYTDVYRQRIGRLTIYNAVGEKKAETYIPAKNEMLVQKADPEIYAVVCNEVNKQMRKAFQWWDVFYKNKRLAMKLLQKMHG